MFDFLYLTAEVTKLQNFSLIDKVDLIQQQCTKELPKSNVMETYILEHCKLHTNHSWRITNSVIKKHTSVNALTDRQVRDQKVKGLFSEQKPDELPRSTLNLPSFNITTAWQIN